MAFGSIIDSILGIHGNTYGDLSTAQWNLSRGVFTNKKTNASMVFFYEDNKSEDRTQRTSIDQITDSGAQRMAVFEYPYLDGQALKPLGRKGEKFSFNIKFYGANYQHKLKEFLDVVNTGDQGTITHPVRGSLTVRFMTYELVHRYDEWNAITIKAEFAEDNTDTLQSLNLPQASQDSALRSALQSQFNIKAYISQKISDVGLILGMPSSIRQRFNNELNSVTSRVTSLLAQLAVTFGKDQQTNTVATQAASAGGAALLNSGTVKTQTEAGNAKTAQLPPVFQVGFDAKTQASIESQVDLFIAANQITVQQAIFSANASRATIQTAIENINNSFGIQGYDMVLQYRDMANQLQTAVEACIQSAQSKVKVYVVPYAMSLRTVAFKNGLSADRQNDIADLNPYISSVNYVPSQTQLVVPAS